MSNFDFGGKPFGGGGLTFGKGFKKKPDPEKDPLKDMEATGNVEEDSKRELTEINRVFRKERREADKRFKNSTDGRFYFAVVFKNADDRKRFFQAINMGLHPGDWWMSGYDLAKAIGVDMGLDDVD